MCVCVCFCPVMRFAVLRDMGLKLGMGVGDGPLEAQEHIFEATPPKVNRSSGGQAALEMPYGNQTW